MIARKAQAQKIFVTFAFFAHESSNLRDLRVFRSANSLTTKNAKHPKG
jgi:hypothetical protein